MPFQFSNIMHLSQPIGHRINDETVHISELHGAIRFNTFIQQCIMPDDTCTPTRHAVS